MSMEKAPMTKAYDLKVLGERLKEAGLVEVEDMAEKTYLIVKEWMKESAPLSATKMDDMVAPLYDHLDPFVLPKVDRLDGQVG
jgi:DNA-binding transcriptional ArsR family regulator